MLTRAGWVTAIASLLAFVPGRLLGLQEFYVFGAIGLVLVALAVLLANLPVRRVAVHRSVGQPRVAQGGTCLVDVAVENGGSRRSPLMRLHDPVSGTGGARATVWPVPPGGSHTATYRVPTGRRGLIELGPAELVRTDPFGLARRRYLHPGTDTVAVYPAIEVLTERPGSRGLDEPLAGLSRPLGDGMGEDDFASLRAYVVGDDLRRVHWASSARAGDLLVRQHDPPWQGHLTVVLDTRDARLDDRHFETAASIAASLLWASWRSGDRTRLVLTDGTDTGMLGGQERVDVQLDHLATVQRGPHTGIPGTAAHPHRRAGGIVVVTGAVGAEDRDPLASLIEPYASAGIVQVTERPQPVHGLPTLWTVSVVPGGSFAQAWRDAGERAGAR